MRLENWLVTQDPHEKWDPYKAPELYTPRLVGDVYGHPTFPDGHTISVSTPVSSDGNNTITTKSGSMYKLGKVNPDYEKSYSGAKQRLINSLPKEN